MPQYHKHLQHVEPLPNLPGLMDAQATLDRLRRDVSLLAELEHFVGRAAALPAVLRFRALASLNTGLCQRRHQLLLPNGCASSHSQFASRGAAIACNDCDAKIMDGSSDYKAPCSATRCEANLMACARACRIKCRPEVEQAAWQLVWLSRDLADDAMAAFTGKLLALVGPLDEHHIAFTRAPAYTQTSGTLSREVPRAELSQCVLIPVSFAGGHIRLLCVLVWDDGVLL